MRTKRGGIIRSSTNQHLVSDGEHTRRNDEAERLRLVPMSDRNARHLA
jgi:hypothetical protein